MTLKSASLKLLGRSIFHVSGGAGLETFVFVHGFGADHTGWMFNLPEFERRGRVFALDLPAHGQSEAAVGDGSVAHFADLLAAYIDVTEARAVHIVAHSLGGAIAMEVARRAPSRVASLSLIAPAGLSPRINPEFATKFAELHDSQSAHDVLALLVADPRRISRQMVGDILAHLDQPGIRDALRRVANANFAGGDQRIDYAPVLASLSTPVRILWGERDQILSMPEAPAIEIVPATGHMPQLEAPARVNRLLLAEWLSGV